MFKRSISRRDALTLILGTGLAGLMESGAGESYGQWSPEGRAEVAEEFMLRMKKEFADRARRLQAFMGKSPVIELKFIDSSMSSDPKTAANWKRFREGRMGEGGTTKWIDKIVRDLESARKALASAEKPASAAWEKKYRDNPPPEVISPAQQAMIYEMDVQAAKLGVIMDSSRSMTRYLPALRGEISSRFANARFVEVDSCYLRMPDKHWGLHGEWYYTTPLENRNLFAAECWLPEIPRNDLHYHIIEWKRDTMAAMTAMVDGMNVDAIYWFCDFDDKIEPPAIKALGRLLEKRKVRLYVHTVKSSPPASLGNLIKGTGGSITKVTPADTRPVPADNPKPVPATPAGTRPAPAETKPLPADRTRPKPAEIKP
ncbi:MAG: hypothetical protein V4726_23880 [Verrucomicrobiota bacterium]